MSFFQTKSAKIIMAVIGVAAIVICSLLIVFLSRQPDEQTPSSEQEEASAVSSRDTHSYVATGEKIAYLTFDDGPSNCTPAILNILQEEGVKASFFVSYQSSATLQGYYADILADGHLLGVKGYVGNDSIYSSASDCLNDLEQMITYLQTQQIQQETKHIRLPGGSNAAVDREVMQQVLLNLNRREYTYYDWNVWADGEGGSATKDEIVRQIVAGALEMSEPVILLHDSNDNDAMVEALPEIIGQLKEAGYGFETVEHMGTPLHDVEYIEPDLSSQTTNSYDPIATSSAYTPSYTPSSSVTSSNDASSDDSSDDVSSGDDSSDADSSDTDSSDTDSSDTDSDTSSADTSYEPSSDTDE